MTHATIDFSTYITITIWFGCNNNCTLCMLGDLKSKLPPVGFQKFQEILMDICEDGKYRNLILSGAEVTTFDKLQKYVRYAASLNYFKKIQIQTNGRRLAGINYVRDLIECGVNEFFVSIHGLPQTHDAITRRTGSFEQTWTGLQNLTGFDVNVISNTVVIKKNFHDIVPLTHLLHGKKLDETHLWNFFTMEKADTGNNLVRLNDVVTLFPELRNIANKSNIPTVFKNFPECLPAKPPLHIDSRLAETLIPEPYWHAFAQNQFGLCSYRKNGACRARHCWGLSSAYVGKYGYERHLLSPMDCDR